MALGAGVVPHPAGTVPIYRFWSPTFLGHFYTVNAAERDKLQTQFSRDWTYEDIAYYAYATTDHPEGTSPVFRFWGSASGHHFFTIFAGERDKLLNTFAATWTYEGSAWYTYSI